MRKASLLLMCLIAICSSAQNIKVSGVVFDEEEGGEGLPGASVIIKSTDGTPPVGTITDIFGNFELEAKSDDVLIVSFMGYNNLEYAINGKQNLNIVLKSSSESLEELVVVGYGVQKKESSVGAISQAKGEDLLKAGSVTTVTEAIQGMMPGVTAISSGSGKPGSEETSIIIRGKASWQGSDPLVLVDGVERDMDDVDPSEIESMSVLKDASATAVFGVKGANGVILITTKRGTNSKPKIDFKANFGFKQPTASPEYADYVTSMEMWNEALGNDQRWDEIIPESTIEAWRNAYTTGNYGQDNDYFPLVNWWDELVKEVGYQQQYNLNIRGGTDFMKYFVSLGYLHDGDIYNLEEQEDYDPSFGYKRYNWRSNLDFNLTKTTLLSANIAGKLGYRNSAGYRIDGGGEDGYGQSSFFSSLYTTAQNQYPVKWSDGTWAVNSAGTGNPVLAYTEGGQRTYKYFQGFLDFKLDQDLSFITKGLKAKGSFSYTSSSNYESEIRNAQGSNYAYNTIAYYKTYDYANPNEDGTYPEINSTLKPDNFQATPISASYDTNNSYNKNIYYELALNYSKSFGDHDMTALALFSRRESKSKTYNVEERQEDWVGRLTYAYKDRYLAEVNGSYNGSEAFASGLRFGDFYSGSLGWRISEEPFIKERFGSWLSNLKMRYSYGTVGITNNNRFLYQQSYTVKQASANWRSGVDLGNTERVSYFPIYGEGDAANEEATWETAIKQNLGLEFGIISKLTGTLELYDEKRKDILMDIWAPLWYLPTGSTSTGNIGETKNHGIEYEMQWNDGIGDNFRYWVKGNISLNEGRIVYKQDGINEAEHLRDAGKPIGWSSTYINNGYYSSLNDIYNYSTPSSTGTQSGLVAGDVLYVDYNGDGVIDGNDQVVNEELSYPLKTYGLSFGASYKGWSCSATFYGVFDVNKSVPDYILYDNVNGDQGVYLSSPTVTDRWTSATASTATKSALHTSTFSSYSRNSSTYSYQDASYCRLKNAEISYSFQKDRIKRYKLSKLQVYVNGNNLLTFTKLDDRLDPEATTLGVYPMVRRYNVGVRASF